MRAFEFESNQNAKVYISTTIKHNYPRVDIQIVSPENMETILIK